MAFGIGVRQTGYGTRVVILKRVDNAISLAGLATGSPDVDVAALIAKQGVSLDDTAVVFGLGPGDFLLAATIVASGEDESHVRDRLGWELEQKMISDSGSFNLDYLVLGGCAFGFAGQRRSIDNAMKARDGALADVEPVALFNACEASGVITNGCTLLMCIEAEGITSVVTVNGLPSAMDAVVYRDQEISTLLADLDRARIAAIEDTVAARLSGYIRESFDRLVSFDRSGELPAPDRIILAGSGVYVAQLSEMIEQQYGIAPVPANPFTAVTNDAGVINPVLADVGAAFTTSLGLALRALEV